jgi:hypothetical protein
MKLGFLTACLPGRSLEGLRGAYRPLRPLVVG